ncbi:MAG: hypothetical protein LBL49_00185 [Clostridiales Family XIII bacterium]|nr:hypothetical protein [Clostridiales Family XIII bacterium]
MYKKTSYKQKKKLHVVILAIFLAAAVTLLPLPGGQVLGAGGVTGVVGGTDAAAADTDAAADDADAIVAADAVTDADADDSQEWITVYSEVYDFEEAAVPEDANDAAIADEAYYGDGTAITNDEDGAAIADEAYDGENLIAAETVHPFGAVKSASSQSPALASLSPLAADFSPLAAETLSIDSVEVINGGAVQALYRPDKVTESDGKYYTSERIASITDPRIFKVSAILPSTDGEGNTLIPGDDLISYTNLLANVKWTYGGKPFADWKKAASSGVNGAFTGAPFITLLNTNLLKSGDDYKLTAEIRFDTPLYAFSATTNVRNNIPYPNYPNVTQGNTNSYHPQLIDTLVGAYELEARFDADEEAGNNPAEVQLGARDLRLSLYDSFNTWPEIDQFVRDLKAQSDNGDGLINNRYVGVQSLAKSLRGNDIWNVVIAESKSAVDEYLNVTKPQIENDPEALAKAIPGGDQKIPIYFNVIHADEVPGIDGNIKIIKSFIYDDTLDFKSVDEVVETGPSGNTNGYATTKDGSGITSYSYKVDDALDKFIIVITITSNTDGRELVLRGNEYGLDHNRQSVAQRTVESVALTSDMRKWNPLEFNEYHGYTSSMLIMPGTGPHSPYFEHDLLYPKAVEHAHTMGNAILGSTPLASFTVPYDYWVDGWDDGGRGASYFYSYLIGSLGRTIEIPYANEDAVDAVATATKSLIYNCLVDRDALYLNKLEFARRALNNEDLKEKVDSYIVNPFKNNELVGRPRTTDASGAERKFFPDYFVIPVDGVNQYNVPEAYEALEQLERNGVKFKRTTKTVTADDITYPTGTYVIDLRQYSRNFVQAALSNGYKSSYFTDTYAETTVDLPTLRGFKATPVWSAGLFDDADDVLTNITRPDAAAASGSEYVVIKSGSVDVIRLVNRLLKGDKPVHIVTSYTPDGKFGDFIAKRVDVASVQDGLTALTESFAAGADGLAAVSTPVVKPRIAAIGSPLTYSYPQGSNVTPFKLLLPYLEFDEEDYSLSTNLNSELLPDYNVVVNYNVNLSSTLDSAVIARGIPYIGIRPNGITSAANLTNFTLGARSSSPGSAEATFKAAILPTSPISSAFADQEAVYLISSGFFGSIPDGTKKLITIKEGDDNFVGGWWRNAPSTESGYDHSLLDGKVSAIYGLAGANKDVPVTLFDTDTFFRINTRFYWPLIGQAIFLGSSGVTDAARPYAAASITENGWTKEALYVDLDVSASDITGSDAATVKQLFKLNSTAKEAAYSVGDTAWQGLDGTVGLTSEGENYIHWYVENSYGESYQGSYGPYYIDLTAPVIDESGAVNDGAGGIRLTALAHDELSGIADYRWQIKGGDGEWKDYASGASAAVEGLSEGDVYEFRAAVSDFAGNIAFGDTIGVRASETTVGVRTDSPSHIGDNVEFTISLKGAHRALSVALEFTLDDSALTGGITTEALNGFTAIDGGSGSAVVWTSLGDGKQKGKVTLIYLAPAGEESGFTSVESQDIFRLRGVAGDLGAAELTLLNVSVSEYGNPALVNSILDPSGAANEITQRYALGDINHDSIVDQLDLNLVLMYYRAESSDSDWNVTDRYGYKPSQADVNEDGYVDLGDIITVYINYSV